MNHKTLSPIRSKLATAVIGSFWSLLGGMPSAIADDVLSPGYLAETVSILASDSAILPADQCHRMAAPPPARIKQGCLTRSPSFWASRPALTAGYLQPALEVCGMSLDTVELGHETSALAALCPDARVPDSQSTQLVRQCTAASLNVAASLAEGGNCGKAATLLLHHCCSENSVCTGATVENYNIEYCITALDMFNHSRPDTLNFSKPVGAPDLGACGV
ncbi:hypothetical protein [Nitrosomonas sp. ANs5]|uniref:hypothetical protein n=1 Tax=Nitrosomonas sp. ANs5 TaxID=3423941 RepID=UPI003D340D20